MTIKICHMVIENSFLFLKINIKLLDVFNCRTFQNIFLSESIKKNISKIFLCKILHLVLVYLDSKIT